MKDWKTSAKAGGIDIPAAELDRLADSLDSLEEAFRPLVKDLTPELEPATGMRLEEESE